MEFRKFESIARLYRDVVITEKIDGMNAAIVIEPGDVRDNSEGWIASHWIGDQFYKIGAQSRNTVLTVANDIQGFAQWVYTNHAALAETLGAGYHFGEWWGKGIQRSYHQKRNWFSLFNTKRWNKTNTEHIDGLLTVPILYSGPYLDWVNEMQLHKLATQGSFAAQEVDDRELDFRAEGIIGWHLALNTYYKVTLDGDGHKGAAKQAALARAEKLAGYPKFNELIGVKNDTSAKLL